MQSTTAPTGGLASFFLIHHQPADRRDIAPFMPVPEHIEFVTALKLSIYPSYSSDWLWPRNGQAIIFLQLWFLSSSFFLVYSQLPHVVWP